MITTTLNTLQETRKLSSPLSTGVYADSELDALLRQPLDGAPNQRRSTQVLSPELLAQLLASEPGSATAKE